VSDDIQLVLGALVAILIIGAMASPLEALGWWGGWYGEGPERRRKRLLAKQQQRTPQDSATPEPSHFIVYLAGIASVAGDAIAPEEQVFLNRLHEKYPRAVIVDDVFPYSVSNVALTGNRPFAWMYKLAYALRMRGMLALSLVINLRNVYNVLISADPRYGGVYNYGTAGAVVDSLTDKGYVLGSGKPILLYGYSGGGQVCLGALRHIKSMTGAPVSMISMGGVMCSDPSLDHAEHLTHLQGQKDWVPHLGTAIYSGRWPVRPGSPWNRARKAGKIEVRPVEHATHFGPKGYLDEQAFLSTGESHLDRTCSIVNELIDKMTPTPGFEKDPDSVTPEA